MQEVGSRHTALQLCLLGPKVRHIGSKAIMTGLHHKHSSSRVLPRRCLKMMLPS